MYSDPFLILYITTGIHDDVQASALFSQPKMALLGVVHLQV